MVSARSAWIWVPRSVEVTPMVSYSVLECRRTRPSPTVSFRANPHIALNMSNGRSSNKKILNRIDRFLEPMATPALLEARAAFMGECTSGRSHRRLAPIQFWRSGRN